MADRIIVGIDLGATHMQVGVVDEDNVIVGRSRGMTRSDVGLHAVADGMVMRIGEACKAANVAISDISAIGIGVPAPVDPTGSQMLNAVNMRLRNISFADEISSRLNGVSVILDNDVNAALWGEYQLGVAKGYQCVIGCWVGTGIGGAVIIDNAIHHGPTGTAGEIGQGTIFPMLGRGGRLFEEHASRTAILDTIKRLIRANEQTCLSQLHGNDLDAMTIYDVAHAIDQKDDLAIDVVKHAAELAGVVTANMVTFLGADAVVFGGGVVEAIGDQYLTWVRESFNHTVFPDVCKGCVLVATKLRENAGLLGAALIAKEKFLS